MDQDWSHGCRKHHLEKLSSRAWHCTLKFATIASQSQNLRSPSACAQTAVVCWRVYDDGWGCSHVHTFPKVGTEGRTPQTLLGTCGTRDAASIWGDTWTEVLNSVSKKVGTECSAFFCNQDGDLNGLCLETTSAVTRRKQLQKFGNTMEKRFEVKRTGHIGFLQEL